MASVRPAVTALDRSQKVELATGKLATTDNQIDLTTGTVKLRAIFDHRPKSLPQSVRQRSPGRQVKDAIVVPVSAIQTASPATFVYLVKRTIGHDSRHQDRRYRWHAHCHRGRLQVGDKVVTDGVDRLRDGARSALLRVGRRAGAAAPAATTPTDGSAAPDAAPAATDPASQAGPRTTDERAAPRDAGDRPACRSARQTSDFAPRPAQT